LTFTGAPQWSMSATVPIFIKLTLAWHLSRSNFCSEFQADASDGLVADAWSQTKGRWTWSLHKALLFYVVQEAKEEGTYPAPSGRHTDIIRHSFVILWATEPCYCFLCWDFRFSRRWMWRVLCSSMWCHIVSVEPVVYVFRVEHFDLENWSSRLLRNMATQRPTCTVPHSITT